MCRRQYGHAARGLAACMRRARCSTSLAVGAVISVVAAPRAATSSCSTASDAWTGSDSATAADVIDLRSPRLNTEACVTFLGEGFWRGADAPAVQICTDVSTAVGLTRRGWGLSTSCRTRDSASTSPRRRPWRACRPPCRGRKGIRPAAYCLHRRVSKVSSLSPLQHASNRTSSTHREPPPFTRARRSYLPGQLGLGQRRSVLVAEISPHLWHRQ
jgi:hypothetical protein